MKLANYFLVTLMVLFVSGTPTTIWAADAGDEGYQALQDIFKPTSPISLSDGHCDVSLIADYDNYRNHMGGIREEWLFKDNSTEFYQRHSYQVLFIVARKQATVLTQGIYLNPEAGSCHFRLLISDQDKFGNDRPWVLLSWSFTRELAVKTHWDKLDDKHFPDLAINYRFGQEFLSRARREALN